ncbi:MAG TPA: hypothetical protein VEF37_06345 [Thermodesulfovibrionales bacterium]|nr:hypothetical protein [Thermodesulfovibrionales bacterium]
MSILPEGEQLRKAVRWISEERQSREDVNLGKLINEACVKFDLSPADTDFLFRFFTEEKSKK